MKNPTASGWYWVWRLGKDVDRNVSCVLYWGAAPDPCSGAALGTGWHDTDDTNFVDGGQPHAREFAAWSGPLLPRTPPESEDEVADEIQRSERAAAATTTLPVSYPRYPVCVACEGPARERYTPVPGAAGAWSCGEAKCRLKIKGGIDAHMNGSNR